MAIWAPFLRNFQVQVGLSRTLNFRSCLGFPRDPHKRDPILSWVHIKRPHCRDFPYRSSQESGALIPTPTSRASHYLDIHNKDPQFQETAKKFAIPVWNPQRNGLKTEAAVPGSSKADPTVIQYGPLVSFRGPHCRAL